MVGGWGRVHTQQAYFANGYAGKLLIPGVGIKKISVLKKVDEHGPE